MKIDVESLGGDRFMVGIRGHEVEVDQPARAGGTDAGPTPTELFVAGLASCVAFYAYRWLDRHELDPSGLRVTAEYAMATQRPSRVAAITLRVDIPAGLPPERIPALRAVVEHCTVHNSITHPPTIVVEVA